MDKHGGCDIEEFYDNLVTCAIKTIDAVIGCLEPEPLAAHKRKGNASTTIGAAVSRNCRAQVCATRVSEESVTPAGDGKG